MKLSTALPLAEIERRVCDLTAKQLDIPRREVEPSSRFIEDLHIDSLDAIELMMEIEEEFEVTLPDDPPNPIYKSVFTRNPLRVSDIAEMVYLQQGTGTPLRKGWRKALPKLPATSEVPFSQLNCHWEREPGVEPPLFEAIDLNVPFAQYRRRSDGMRCVLIPSAVVEFGSDAEDALADERPLHRVEIDAFLIDAEPVSTIAYCRFLNSIELYDNDVLGQWFLLDPQDDRIQHLLVRRTDGIWHPITGAEKWPMILVSWFGATAYSLWANGRDWRNYRGDSVGSDECFLPSEAQWEYAARGDLYQTFPWGEEPPSLERMTYGLHRKGASYEAESLPLAVVNEKLGMSIFGLHHMAGNVWQWCRDWYDAEWYSRDGSREPNAMNQHPSGIRSERGGSWIGPAELCRSSYRRGRPPYAFGRCLGFRCVSSPKDLPKPVAKSKWSMFGS